MTRPRPMPIRIARAVDAQTLAHIAWAAKAYWNYPPAQMAAWRGALSPDAASIATCPTFLVEQFGTPVGFYQLQPAATSVELAHLWVLPRCMGQGLGHALLDHAMEQLAALGMASLHIDADPHAERFYRRCGAIPVDAIAAPIEGQPGRVRPQLSLTTQAFIRYSRQRAG